MSLRREFDWCKTRLGGSREYDAFGIQSRSLLLDRRRAFSPTHNPMGSEARLAELERSLLVATIRGVDVRRDFPKSRDYTTQTRAHF